MDFSFFGADAFPVILALLFGAAGALISYFSWKAASSPNLAKFKDAYPVFNMVMAIAAETLQGTKYGVAFEAAYTLWLGRGLSPSQSRQYAKAMIESFDLDKYVGMNLETLSPQQVERGEAIARQILPGYEGSPKLAD